MRKRPDALIQAQFSERTAEMIRFGYSTEMLPIMFSPSPEWHVRVRPNLLNRNHLPPLKPT